MSISNQQFIALIKKNTFSAGCGVLSLILAAGIYFRSDELPAARAVLEGKSAEGQRLAANLRNAVQLKEQLDKVQAADKAIEARLVKASASSQLATNAQYFYRLEADAGVKLVTINQLTNAAKASQPGKSTFVPIAFDLSVHGSYAQILDLLHRLENGAHYCRVLSANVSKVADDGTDLLNLTLSIELLGQQ